VDAQARQGLEREDADGRQADAHVSGHIETLHKENNMKIRTIFGLIAACLATTSYAQKAMSIAEWQKGYNEAAKAFEAKDVKKITSYMAPNFTMRMDGKTMNRKEAAVSLAQWFAEMKDLHCSMKVTQVMHKGSMATVTDTFKNWGMTKADPKTKKSSKLVQTGVDTATWVWMNGKWMMKSISTSNEKMTIDGKPVKM
jgi:hypothetical protein